MSRPIAETQSYRHGVIVRHFCCRSSLVDFLVGMITNPEDCELLILQKLNYIIYFNPLLNELQNYMKNKISPFYESNDTKQF